MDKTTDIHEKALLNRFSLQRNIRLLFFGLALLTGFIYYFSNPRPQHYYDYTFRVAGNILQGKIGLDLQPPPHLNEMIPFEGAWFSAFPFGAVVTYLPVAALKVAGIISENPAGVLAGVTAAGICLFLLLISTHYKLPWRKRVLLVTAILFGSWMWTNLTMAGAWHLALGFAMLGEIGAIYFALYHRNAFLAGCFFALAFGNRTEILLTAPIFMYLLINESFQRTDAETQSKNNKELNNLFSSQLLRVPALKISQNWKALALFCVVPSILGISTLTYNYLRFHSFTDFGYARIPGVLNEPWYRYGIFALSYIPLNIQEMLATQWKYLPHFPYFVPTGFGGAVWWSSPFLVFLLRPQARNKIIWRTAWVAIAVLTFLLWTHGNPGGWQFGYRYAMVLLPWMFLILLENSPEEITFNEILAYGVSFAVNAWATYLFFWTDYVKP